MMLLNRLITEDFNRLLIVGPSGSGKTTLVRYLLSRIRFTSLYVLGENVHTRDSPYTPYSKYFTVTDVLDWQEIDKWRKRCDETKGKKYLILDDIVSYKLHLGANASKMEAFFSSCRHQGISIFAVCHSYKSLPPTCRQQYTDLVVCRINADIFKHLIKDYISMETTVSDNVIISRLRVERYQYLVFFPHMPPGRQFGKFRLKM